MKYFIPSFLLICFLCACHKNNERVPITEAGLKGTWRVIAQWSGPDTLHQQGSWIDIDYAKQTGEYDIYCITDSRFNQSFLSLTNCSYQDMPGSYIGVLTFDCARTVFMRDTVWSQLSNFDFTFGDSNQFTYLDQYNHSKRVNLFNQHCNPVQYTPAYSTKTSESGTWTYREVDQIITIDYGTGQSPFDGQKQNRCKVLDFTTDEIVVRFQGGISTDLKLHKL